MATPSFQQKMHRAMVLRTVRTIAPGILLLLLILAALVGVYVMSPSYGTQDLQGSKLHQSIGTVTSIYYAGNRQYSHNLVLLEVDGKRTEIQAPALFQIGQRVQVVYRVGKSGQIYAQGIAPLPDN